MINEMNRILKYKYLIIIVLFGLLYSLIVFVNHYLFRTYALDLGLYTQAAYKYAHLKIADSTMMKCYYEPLLGGHFDLYLILFSPLIYIFGTYTLLIVQIVAILLGGIGIYNLFKIKENKKVSLAFWAMIYFYSFFGIFSALSYDYHSVVVASAIIPWFFYTIKLKKFWLSALLLFFILISQENISLWLFFICIGLIIEFRTETRTVFVLSIFAMISIIYFIVVIQYIIPLFSVNNQYGGFLYSVLGNTPAEALKTLLTNPFNSIKILFINHTNNSNGDYVKLEFHIFILLSGGYLLFKKPAYLLMLVPLYAQKLFHNDYIMWGIDGQYSVEFAPILAIGTFSVLKQIKNKCNLRIVLGILLVGTIGTTIRLMDHTKYYTNKSRIRFYQASHYQHYYDVKNIYKQLNQIPVNASVSAQSSFVPHLALRDKIYQFPIIKDAGYIVLSPKGNTYPMEKDNFDSLLYHLEDSKKWIVKYKSKELIVLKKVSYNR